MHASGPDIDATGSSTFDDAIGAIAGGGYELVTFDVFDTLVWRPVRQPHHLFTEIGRRLIRDGALPPWIDEHAFAYARVRAEWQARDDAREAHTSPECTLEEIWAKLPEGTTIAPDDGIAAELDTEHEHLRAHRSGLALLDAARAAGCRVAYVSDSYFSVDQLRHLLESAGVPVDGVEIVTSSSRRKHKYDGLLADVVTATGVAPDRVLHVGDNPVADVVVAQREGYAVCHVALDEETDAVTSSHRGWHRISEATSDDGGRSAALRETYARAGEIANEPGYQFGAAVAGPIMASFVGWASATAEELGADALHCLLREGGRIAELADVMRPEGPERVLVHASRWAIMRATVFDCTRDELARTLERRSDFRAEHVVEAFGCDLADVRRVIGDGSYSQLERFDAWQAISDDDSLRARILEESARLRAGATRYLDRTLRIGDGPIVLCDIGWGGRIQEGITALLRGNGVDNEVIGLYSMLSVTGWIRAAEGHHLVGFLPIIGDTGHVQPHAAVALRHAEFLERVNTPPIGTLLTYDPDGAPVTMPDDHDVIPPSLEQAQRGVIDFCRTLAPVLDGDDELRRRWFAGAYSEACLEGISSVITSPEPALAAALSTWEHDDVAGTAAERLANDEFVRWSRFANGADASEIVMNDVFWVAGAAAARPMLAAQLQAIRGGADPDELCPPSETGSARVAVFPPDSDLASHQLEAVPRVGPLGWMLVQFDAEPEGLRSVRIDLGDAALLAEIGDIEIRCHTATGEFTLVDGVASLADATLVGASWVAPGRLRSTAGGHLLFDPGPEITEPVRRVDVSVGFRTWTIDEVPPGSAARVRRGIGAIGRRFVAAARQLKRRLPSSST